MPKTCYEPGAATYNLTGVLSTVTSAKANELLGRISNETMDDAKLASLMQVVDNLVFRKRGLSWQRGGLPQAMADGDVCRNGWPYEGGTDVTVARLMQWPAAGDHAIFSGTE